MKKILLILHLLLLLSLPATLQVINQDAHIVMEPTTFMVLGGNFTNNGTFNQAAGTVRFTGGNSIVSGTVVPGFFNLQLWKAASSAAVSLNTDITVKKAIQFSSGLINLNNRNITLEPTALLQGESETSRITGPGGGFVQITVPLNAPSGVNPGNLGMTFYHPASFGITTIRRGHVVHAAGPSNKSIFRFFEIRPTSGSLAGARLRIHYLNAELNGIHPNCLIIYRSLNRSTWLTEMPVFKDPSAKYVERSGVGNAPYWTLSFYETGMAAPCSFGGKGTPLMAGVSIPTIDFIKRIYPTAGVKTSLYIETGHLPVKTIQLMLYDAQGNLLLNKQLTYQSQWLTIPAVSAGVYQVKVLAAEHLWQGKFVKE